MDFTATKKTLEKSFDKDVLKEVKSSNLSLEQADFVTSVIEGQNICVTGNAGTGKTYLLNWMRQHLPMAVTASTGIAALHITGTTIHAWAGLRTGKKSAAKIVEDLIEKHEDWGNQAYPNMKHAVRLVIDELSMFDGIMLELLNQVLQIVREDDRPFGGLQVIFFCDFLQLPPVTKGGKKPIFAFETNVWEEAKINTRLLTKVFRQKEQRFSDVLHKIRMGDVDDEVIDFLIERSEAEDPEPDKPSCILHSHNKSCASINKEALEALPGEVVTLKGSETCKNKIFLAALEKNCLAPLDLELKIGARVMLLKNVSFARGLANGSMGTVKQIESRRVWVVFDNGNTAELDRVTFDWVAGTGEIVATRRQFPLRLASAITIHKSQGMSLDKVSADLSKCFAEGQSYVALSRARSAEGLFLLGDGCKISANKRAVGFYQKLAT